MIKRISVLLVIAGIAFSSFAQGNETKLGHINVQNLLEMMPEYDSAKKEFQKEQRSIQKQIEQMQVELNKKFQEYQQQQDSLTPLLRQSKEEEIRSLQQRMQSFQRRAQQQIQKTRQKLFEPVTQKAQNAIDRVAEREGFTYVFDTSAGAVVYQGNNSIDILPLVKKELGLSADTEGE